MCGNGSAFSGLIRPLLKGSFVKIIRATLVAISATFLLVPLALAQWPTTCVELNDIVEAHLGNDGNVGIYQKVFGDQAEQACQNDHREDVRGTFVWAIGETQQPVSAPAPQPTPAPAPAPVTTESNWEYEVQTDPITGNVRHFAKHFNDSFDSIYVRCGPHQDDPLDIYVSFADAAEGDITADFYGDVEVAYRVDSNPGVESFWSVSLSGTTVFAPENEEVMFGRSLAAASTLLFRAVSYENGRHYEAAFSLVNGAPVTAVLAACGH